MFYKQNFNRAAIYIIIGGLSFAIMGILIKLISADVSTEVIVFFRNLFGFIVILPFVMRQGFRVLPTKIPYWHLARSLAGLAAMYSFFYSINYIPLSNSILLSYTTPLFAPFMIYFLMGEKISVKLFLPIAVGFVGILFLLNPDFSNLTRFSWPSLIALFSGLFAALAMTSIRRMSKTEPSIRIVFYYGLICTSISAIPMISFGTIPELNNLLILLAIGFFASGGQVCITRGFSLSPIVQVGPFIYSTVVFATLFAWLYWQEIPTVTSGVGILLVIIAGSFALRQSQSDVENKSDTELKS